MPASKRNKLTWLLLLFRLPATHKAERVAVWRKLRKSGAIQLTTSTYLLPDVPARYEIFQWLTKEIRDAGGDATLVRAREIEGLSNADLIELFNNARNREYGELIQSLRAIARPRKSKGQNLEEVSRMRKRFGEISEMDFFHSPRAAGVEMLLHKLEQPESAKRTQEQLNPRKYRSRTWLTRPRPEIDRVGSAWLIRRFIDPKARFAFGASRASQPKAISFDMLDADFSHEGEDCTFETLVRRFAIKDAAVRKIGEMIHDADLEDGKFQRNDCVGIDRALKGWAKEGLADDEILKRGALCFDGLYAFVRKS